MTTISRRTFSSAVLAAPFAWSAANAARVNSTVKGVRLGAITYTFRDMPRQNGVDNIDDIIRVLTACEIGEIELFAPNTEPGRAPGAPRTNPAEVREWRLKTPMSHFENVRRKFDAAGIRIYAYTMNYRGDFTDPEIDKTFEQAKALGVDIISSSTQVGMTRRLLSFAEKHKIYLAFHGHSEITKPDEFSTPATFQQALDMSKYAMVNLDIGHFTAANQDPIAYIEQHHKRISHLHIKDRKKNDGPNVEWGQGDTDIKGVLQLLAKKKYRVPAFIEYEYMGKGNSEAEAKKCMAFMKQALA